MRSFDEPRPSGIGQFQMVVVLRCKVASAERRRLKYLKDNLVIGAAGTSKQERCLLWGFTGRKQVSNKIAVETFVQRKQRFHAPSLNRSANPRHHASRFDPFRTSLVAIQFSTDQEKCIQSPANGGVFGGLPVFAGRVPLKFILAGARKP